MMRHTLNQRSPKPLSLLLQLTVLALSPFHLPLAKTIPNLQHLPPAGHVTCNYLPPQNCTLA